MTMNHETIYGEVGQNYRKFLDWREKIIGGYVAIIGGLGFAYYRSDISLGFRAILLVAAILTSVAFWLFNMRNNKFLIACVRAGQNFEDGKGVYTGMGTLTHTSKLTHGLAVNLLVSFVIVGSLFGLWNIKECGLQIKFCAVLVGLLMAIALTIGLEYLGDPDPEASTRIIRQGTK